MTQTDRIINYIEEFGSISTLEAFNDLGITRLAARVADIKKRGIDVQSEMVSGTNRFGERISYKRYWL